MQKRIALLSVYHKTRIADFARALVDLNWEVYASGGTADVLHDTGIPVKDVMHLVGGTAILGHRVVTLSREIHAGLLATSSAEDVETLARLGIPRIDLVCVDMYPLKQAIARADATLASVTESTDIGGPALLRSAAKGRRIVIADADDREIVLQWLGQGEPDGEKVRLALAAKAEKIVADYCQVSAQFLASQL